MRSAASDEPPARLDALWSARAIAVVGASPKPGSPGRLVVEHLLRYGYPGRIVPVHPTATQVAGCPAFATATAAAQASITPIDLAVILVPVEAVNAAIDDCAAAGTTTVIVGTSGFAEGGAAGRAQQAELTARCRAAGIRLVGPNCIGAANLWTGQIASFSPLFSGERTQLLPGGVALASTSGALGYGVASLALERGIGLGWTVTTGNEADVTTVEALAALATLPECTAALGYLEGLTDRAGLAALARAGKPTAVLVAGSSAAGAKAAALHTGALATPARVTRAALLQYGIVQVSDVDELLDVGDAFALAAAAKRWPRGQKVAVLTTSGGSGILAADAIATHGLELATLAQSTVDLLTAVVPSYGSVANPVDVTATVMRDQTLMARCLAALADDDGVDLIVACFCVLTGADVDAIVTALDAVAHDTGKPILVARTGAAQLAPDAAAALRQAHVPAYPTPSRAVRAAAAMWQVAPDRARESPPSQATPATMAIPELSVGEAVLKQLLSSAGIRVPAGEVVNDPRHAPDAVRRCTTGAGRAVLKVVSASIVHKSDVGGVMLDVSAEQAQEVAARLLRLPGAAGVLVEEQLPPGVEVLVGLAPSPLGRILTVGVGGVLTELVDDVAVRLLPVDDAGIRQMLAETRLARLLSGARGRPPADVEALVSLISQVVELSAAWPLQASLDFNPVSVSHTGAVVLDAAYAAGVDEE